MSCRTASRARSALCLSGPCSFVRITGALQITAATRVGADPGKGAEAFRFNVVTEKQTYTLCAKDKKDMDAWIECLAEVRAAVAQGSALLELPNDDAHRA